MQAYPTRPWPQELTCRVICQSCVEFPVIGAVRTDSEARCIDPCIDCSRFIGAARFNYPDILEFLLAIFGKLNALLRLVPGQTKIVAVAQKCTEEIAVVCREQATTAALVEKCVENRRSFQSVTFDFPHFQFTR